MMLHSIVRFLVFFAAATGAEAAQSRSNPQARSLQLTRHFSAPGARAMPPTQNAAQRVFSPSPAPNASPTNVPALLPSDVANYLFPVLEPSLAPIASPTTAPTTVPTRASDAIVTTTTPPAPEPTRAPDSFTLFTPTASPVEVPALEEETTNGGVGTTKTQGGLGPGAGTALGAGLLVLIGGVFILRRKGKKDDEADATTAQPTDLEGGSSA